MQERDRELRGHSRRRFIATTAALGVGTLAGCTGGDEETETTTEPESGEGVEQIGSGRSQFGDRDITGGVSVSEMPDLSGELTLYSGRGKALVGELISFFEEYYDDFTIRPRYNSATELVNQIQTEGQNSPADVFFSVN
ncbi:iron ABC transporter substrate-binding protein, partial [Halorubrum sp. Atlit-26R]